MKKLDERGPKVKISLSTLEKKNSLVDSYLLREITVSDLDENDFINLSTLYTRPKIPVNGEDIPTQEDVDRWPHLNGIFIPTSIQRSDFSSLATFQRRSIRSK